MEGIYEIDEIIDHRGKGKFRGYLIKWKGYEDLTWQSIKTFDTTECIHKYWKKKEEEV